jgi:MFS family permease
MIRAGFLGAIAGLIYITSLTLLSPFCTLCLTPILGIGVGYLAAHIDKPARPEASLSRGGLAGSITGIGVLIGQMLATVVNGILITNSEGLPIFVRQMGLAQLFITDPDEYWQAIITTSSFCSLINLVLIAGLGALGSLIWYQRQRRYILSEVAV